jgi:LysR family hydrogen peroxide-inducible transcriptional activator
MTLIELRYVVALATEGSFSRAAARCAVSQPSLSLAVARLEKDLGVRLFERAKAGKGLVKPTGVGAEIVRQAQIALRESERIREIAQHGRDELVGALHLGVIHTVGPYLLPGLIGELKRVAPKMPLVIEENMTAALADMLRDSEIDVAVVALPFDMPGVETRPLYDEPFVFIAPRGHRWENRDAIDPSEVRGDEVLLLKAGNCFRDQVLGACPQVSRAETDAHLGYSVGTLRLMVASGLGVSILPASAMLPPYANDMIVTLPFAEPRPSRRIALAWRAGFSRPKAIEALARAVRALPCPVFVHARGAAPALAQIAAHG